MLLEIFYNIVLDHCVALAKAQDVTNSLRVANESIHGFKFKTRKDIGRKHRFSNPSGTLTSNTFKSNPWAIDFDTFEFSKMGRGDVLMFGLAMNTKPFGSGIVCRGCTCWRSGF